MKCDYVVVFVGKITTYWTGRIFSVPVQIVK